MTLRPAAVLLALAGVLLLGRGSVLAVTVLPPSSATVIINTPGVYEGGPIDVDCGANNNVQINADNVTLRNLTLSNANEAAIKVGAFKGLTIENVSIKGFNCANGSGQYRAGVACWGCTALTVRDSTIETGKTYGNGIWVKNYSLSTGGGHVIEGNTISGGWDGIGGEPEDSVYGGVYRDTLIEGNTIAHCHDDGIQVEGGNVNVTVRGNRVEDCGIGVAFAPNISGPLYLERNTIRNLRVGDYGQQACYKVGDGGKGIAYITGDICITKGDGVKQTNSGLNPFVTQGNCWVVSRYVIELTTTAAAGTSFEGDTLWTSDPDRFVKWNNTRYGSLPSFQKTGQETTGVQSPTCSSVTPTPAPTPSSTATSTPSLPSPSPGLPTPTTSPTSTSIPSATSTPTPTPTSVATLTPTPVPTAVPRCQLRARINGVVQWVTVPCSLLGLP